MAKLEIITYGNPILRHKAEEVKEISKEILKITDGMMETLKEEGGIGLAAVQVGIPKRILVVDLTKSNEDKKITLLNPRIIYRSIEEEESEEGCLSIPEVWGSVSRPGKVKVKGVLPGGKVILIDADGILARVLQHEIDHLEGRLFIDYFSPEEREKNKEKIEAILELNKRKLGNICL